MKILAIETATAVCSAAIVENGKSIGERSIESQQVHSEKLMTLIDDLLTSSGTSVKSIEGLAVSIGPGSFTGLRIGLSTAKGLAYALNVPLAAVPTLEALAFSALRQNLAGREDILLPMIDARRNEVYAAVYNIDDNGLNEYISVRAIAIDDLRGLLPHGKRVVLLGDGVEKFQQMMKKQTDEIGLQVISVSREQRQCAASSVGVLGEQQLIRGKRADIAALEPLYVKEFYTTMQIV